MVHLIALDLLESAAMAGDVLTAVEAMRPDIEVMEREDLVRLAMALAVESGIKLTPLGVERVRLLDRIQHSRLEAQWRIGGVQ